MAIKQAKVIAVTSVKGGTGKTTTVLALAGILSNKKIKTIIVDMDLHSGVIGASLNLKSNKDIYTLINDYMNHNLKEINDYISKYNDYIDVLPAPKDPRSVGKINSYYIDSLLKKLKYKYDVILIDTNHIIDDINLITFDNADNIIYIMTSDLMDLRNMKTMLAIYKDMNLNKYTLILNEVLNKLSLTPHEINAYLGRNIDYIIPSNYYIKNMKKLIMEGKIVTLEKNYQKDTILKEVIDNILKG